MESNSKPPAPSFFQSLYQTDVVNEFATTFPCFKLILGKFSCENGLTDKTVVTMKTLNDYLQFGLKLENSQKCQRKRFIGKFSILKVQNIFREPLAAWVILLERNRQSPMGRLSFELRIYSPIYSLLSIFFSLDPSVYSHQI